MPRRGENIYKRKDGRWEGRYCSKKNTDGRKHYISVYAHSYREVKEKLRSCKEAAAPGRILFRNIAEQWLAYTKLNVKISTYNNYRYLLNKHILMFFGNIDMRKLCPRHVNRFITEKLTNGKIKRNEGISKKYLQDMLVIVKAIAAFCEQEYEILDKIRKVKSVRYEQTEMKTLNQSEQKMLTKKLITKPSRFNIGILLSLYTGLRLGEVCGLRWSDFNEQEHTITIRRTVQRISDNDGSTIFIEGTPKTKASIRTIPLPDFIWKILCGIKSSSDIPIISESENYIEPALLRKYFGKILKENKINPIRFHDLRHTFATNCIRLNFDIKTLSEILGHSSVSMTLNRYVHSSMEIRKEYMSLIRL